MALSPIDIAPINALCFEVDGARPNVTDLMLTRTRRRGCVSTARLGPIPGQHALTPTACEETIDAMLPPEMRAGCTTRRRSTSRS